MSATSTKVRLTYRLTSADLGDRFDEVAYSALPVEDVVEGEVVSVAEDGSWDVRRTNEPERGVVTSPGAGAVWTVSPGDFGLGLLSAETVLAWPEPAPDLDGDGPVNVTGLVFTFRCLAHDHALLPNNSYRPGTHAWDEHVDLDASRHDGVFRLDLLAGFYCPDAAAFEPELCRPWWTASVEHLDDTARCPRCLHDGAAEIGDEEHAQFECYSCGAAWSADEGRYLDRDDRTPMGGYRELGSYR